MKLLKTRTFHFRRTCANFSSKTLGLPSSFSPSSLLLVFHEPPLRPENPYQQLVDRKHASNALSIFVKASVVDSLRFFVAGLKNGLLASVFLFAKEHKKSLNAEVENKSCGRLFEPILISTLLYKSIHLGSKIIKKFF